jgi:hypothetical protein
MLGFPFIVWSGRTALASAAAKVESSGQPEPSRAAKIWLVGVPAMFIAYYFISSHFAGKPELDALGQPVDEGGRQWMFLALSPAAGMILGYAAGVKVARDRFRRRGQ